MRSGTTGPHDLSREPLTERVAKLAYAEAGIGPADLGVIELHDAFTIAGLLYHAVCAVHVLTTT